MKEDKTIYLIESLDGLGSDCDFCLGYAETEQEASSIVETLNKHADRCRDRWNEHCVNCPESGECYDSREEAEAELKRVKSEATCKLDDLEVVEEAGSYSVQCKNIAMPSDGDVTYVVNKVQRMTLEDAEAYGKDDSKC